MATPNDMPAREAAGKDGSLVERLLRQAKAQPAKAAATGLLVCVLAVLLLSGFSQPRKATAGDLARSLVPPRGVPQSQPAIRTAAALLQAAMPALAPAAIMEGARWSRPRDIFAVDLRRFPKAGSVAAEGPSEVSVSELPNEAAVRLADIKRQAGELRLEGTVTGPTRAAFINGVCVPQGEQCGGFRLVRVGEQSVQLEREGVRLELRMAE